MQRMRILKTLKLFSLGMLWMTAAFTSFAFTQGQPAPKPATGEDRRLFTVDLVRIQMGKAAEWETIVKNELLPAMKKGGVSEFITLSADTFGGYGEYMLFRLIKDPAELDGSSPVVKALGQAGDTALFAKLDKVTASVRTLALETRPSLSLPPSEMNGKVISLTRHSVAPGRMSEAMKYAREWLPVLSKTNAKGILAGRVINGGNTDEIWQATFFDSYADLAQLVPALAKASAELKVAPIPAGIVTRTEQSTYRFKPELSIQPARRKAAN